MPDRPIVMLVRDASGQEREVKVLRQLLPALVSELGFAAAPAFFLANPHVLFTVGERIERKPRAAAPVAGPEREPTAEELERALALLLRAIARAMMPQPAQSAPADELVGGQPAFARRRREGCDCPCPDGVTVDFLIEYDAPGGFATPDPDLFSGSLRRGRVSNPPGGAAGSTQEIEGSATVSLSLGNPALGMLNSGDVIVTFTVKPFFGAGFDDDDCCITARGTFVGSASVASYTDRGKPGQTVTRGSTNINQTVDCGSCEDAQGEPCCVMTCRWPFDQGFTMKALGYDVDSSVTGTITLVVSVWDHA